MVNVILSHEVSDFSLWKKNFDEGAPLRDTHGVKINGVYTAVDNPNHVTIVSEFPSVEGMQAFMASPELQAGMEQGGVIGKPDVKVLNSVQ